MNLAANEVEVCRAPTGDQYASVAHVGRDGILEPELLSGVAIAVAAILG